MRGSVGHRPGTLAAAVATAALAAAAVTTADAPGAARRLPNWARPQIAVVVKHGLLGAQSVQTFRPSDPLTRGALVDLSAGLAQELTAADPGSGSTDPGSTDTTASGTTTTTRHDHDGHDHDRHDYD